MNRQSMFATLTLTKNVLPESAKTALDNAYRNPRQPVRVSITGVLRFTGVPVIKWDPANGYTLVP